MGGKVAAGSTSPSLEGELAGAVWLIAPGKGTAWQRRYIALTMVAGFFWSRKFALRASRDQGSRAFAGPPPSL